MGKGVGTTRTVIEIIAASAAFARGWAERLIEPRIPASRMRGCSDRTKIKLLAAGFRLVVEVRDHTKVPVLVVAAGKRERNAVYRQAAQR